MAHAERSAIEMDKYSKFESSLNHVIGGPLVSLFDLEASWWSPLHFVCNM